MADFFGNHPSRLFQHGEISDDHRPLKSLTAGRADSAIEGTSL